MKKESVSVTTLATNPDSTLLLLEGQLIIRNAREIKNELVLALNSSQNVELIFKNITKMDLAVLQLLIALQKSASRLQKKLLFDIELTGYIKSVIQNSGLEKLFIKSFKSHVNGIY